MSEVVQCDVCEAIVDPRRPRALCEPAWIAVDDGGPRMQHVCSPQCLARLAVAMGGTAWTDESVEKFARQFAETEMAAREAGAAAVKSAFHDPTADPDAAATGGGA